MPTDTTPEHATFGQELWDFSAQANYQGHYALTLPEGSYSLAARSWGWYGEGQSTSLPINVVVDQNGVLTAGSTNPIDFHMQDPNFSVKVVDPTTKVGIASVKISGVFKNKYFGGSTNGAGEFSAFIDTTTATTCDPEIEGCQITIFPTNNPKYTQVTYPLTSIATPLVLTPGKVTCQLTIRIPTNGGVGLPDRWSWASVNEINESGTVIVKSGYGANVLGQVGLGLVTGRHYSITAYPSGDYYDRYSPKTLDIPSFAGETSTVVPLTITFDSPNVTFIVTDKAGNGNMWGWYETLKKSGDSYVEYNSASLNDQGRGAQYLSDGDYQITFYPGKSGGVTKVVNFSVKAGHAETSETIKFSNDVGRVSLGNGNVTGTVRDSNNAVLGNIPVTAKSNDGENITVSTVTNKDGTYELNLDSTKSWIISALLPAFDAANVKISSDLNITFATTTESKTNQDIKFS